MPKVVHSQPTASGLGLRDRKLRVYILRFIKLRGSGFRFAKTRYLKMFSAQQQASWRLELLLS